MFIVFGIVLALLMFVGILGFQIDVFLSVIPFWLAKKTAAWQSFGDITFWSVITYIVGIACSVATFIDAFSPDIYFGFKPIIITGVYCLIVLVITCFSNKS